MKDSRGWVLDKRICWVVVLAFCWVALIPTGARAAMIESRLADGGTVSERAEMIDTIRQALEKEVVSQRLADYGLSPQEIAAKLPTLSDEQLHQLASLSDSLGEGGVLGTVIAVLLVVLLVVVILKVVDKEIVIR